MPPYIGGVVMLKALFDAEIWLGFAVTMMAVLAVSLFLALAAFVVLLLL